MDTGTGTIRTGKDLAALTWCMVAGRDGGDPHIMPPRARRRAWRRAHLQAWCAQVGRVHRHIPGQSATTARRASRNGRVDASINRRHSDGGQRPWRRAYCMPPRARCNSSSTGGCRVTGISSSTTGGMVSSISSSSNGNRGDGGGDRIPVKTCSISMVAGRRCGAGGHGGGLICRRGGRRWGV